MKILVTNDDGIKAPGIKALVQAVPEQCEVVVAAPANEKSASSHSITLGTRLRIVETKLLGRRAFAVHGTPADCVKFAISEIDGFYPDLILSGINQGANTGVSVYYSGTISAAREGMINKIPSIAVSLCSRTFRNYDACQDITSKLVAGYLSNEIPHNILLNVNVPPTDRELIKGAKITKQASSHFIEEFIEEKNHGGTRVYSLAGEIEVYDPDGTSDEEAVMDRMISITPLRIDLTHYESMGLLNEWINKKKATKTKNVKKPEGVSE